MACTCGHSPVLLLSNNASMITRSNLSSALRARQSKLDVRIAGSQPLRRDSINAAETCIGARRYFVAKLSISRRVNLRTCSAVRGEGETTVPDESTMQLMDVVGKRVQPYLKLARFRLTGEWPLVLWPFCWGAALAAENGTLPNWRIYTLLVVAFLILHAAVNTVNNLWDKEIDGKCADPCGLGVGTQMERVHWMVRRERSCDPRPPCTPSCFDFFCCLLLDPYVGNNLRSPRDQVITLLFGSNSKLWLTGFGTIFVANLGIVGYIAALGWPFYVGVVAAATHVVWQIASVDFKNPIDCLAKGAALAAQNGALPDWKNFTVLAILCGAICNVNNLWTRILMEKQAHAKFQN